MNRETIYAALFAKLSATSGFVTKSRRLKHYTDVTGQEQPALFQEQKNESVTQKGLGIPPLRTLRVHVWVYAQQPDHAAAPATTLNALLDAIETALAPSPVTNTQTLGGLVSHCWISGTIETDDGSLDSQAVARIPIEILVP